MAFHDPVFVELFDKDDEIIAPVMRPISIVQNIEAHDFNYIAVQVELHDEVMRDVLARWARGELIQYRVSGRWGFDTGDVNSVYAYDEGGSGEFSFYGRSHKEIMKHVIGFGDPSTNTVETAESSQQMRGRQYSRGYRDYTGKAAQVMADVLRDNFVSRMGQKMRFDHDPSHGSDVHIRFRFDEIHQHFYENTREKGGALLRENGNVIFNIHRDFEKHEYVLTSREPVRHDQMIEVRSGMIERWQFTSERAEADRVIVGGPREATDRLEASVSRAPKNRRYVAEAFVEHTSPDLDESDRVQGENPSVAELNREARASLLKMIEYAEGKLEENGPKAGVTGQIVESESFHLGGGLEPGDWVRIGVDSKLPLGEQELEKAVVTWSREDGYKVTLTKPDGQETTELSVLRDVMKALRELATRDRRK